MEEVLYRITTKGEGSLREKGSKFFAYAYPVRHVEAVEANLQTLKKQYHDARHHCYAYRLGAKGQESFATDDREPSNSAGPPILAAIRSANLTDTLVVVIRYFGGTKLGIRGLIEAYRSAAELALAPCSKAEIVSRIAFSIRYTYEQTSTVNRILHQFPVEILKADYAQDCTQTLVVLEQDFTVLKAKFGEVLIDVKHINPVDA